MTDTGTAIKNVLQGAATVSIAQEAAAFINPLVPWLIFAIVLTLADLNFGVKAATKRGEKVRPSRAARRTLSKIVDNVCWIILAGMTDKVLEPTHIPYITTAMLLLVYGIEINSCYSNYFEARGIKARVNIFKFFSRKIDIIEVEEKEEEKDVPA